MTGFTLKNSAQLFPEAGFDPGEDHFAVMLDEVAVGTIYRIEDEWMWSLDLGMIGITSAERILGRTPDWPSGWRGTIGSPVGDPQLRKLDYHIDAAQARGVESVLDIGCGSPHARISAASKNGRSMKSELRAMRRPARLQTA